MRSLVWSFAASLLAAPALLLGCNKTNNIDTDNTTNNIYQKTIGMDGGLVGAVKGPGVFVPANALTDDVDVRVREAEEDEYPALPAEAVGAVYSFEPHGVELAAPATFHLPFPNPKPMLLSARRADVGGTFGPVSGMSDASGDHFTFQSSQFGFVVLFDPMGGGGDPGGKPGDTCMRTEGLPEGFASPQGSATVADSDGAAVGAPISSGYAVRDVVNGENTRLQLVFGQRTESCVYGVAAGGSEDLFDDPIGARNTSNFVVSLVLSAATPGTPDELEADTTYPRTDAADEAKSALVVFDDACVPNPPPAQQSGTSITITSIDADGVQGTLATEDAESGASLSATFNLKYCPLPVPAASRCCPQ